MSTPSNIQFQLNGQTVDVVDCTATTTLLDWLRNQGLTGTKEGCAEGDCGACSVAIRAPQGDTESTWQSVCSCILPLASVADKHVTTVEGVADGRQLHPAQQAMVDTMGSQCGYCTPGFVMSLFEATYRPDLKGDGPGCAARRDDQLCGNLCRCTGYRPIRHALEAVAGTVPEDRFSADLKTPPPALQAVDFEGEGQRFLRPTSWAALWAGIDGVEPRYVAGATDLGLEITKKGATWPLLVDLGALPEMHALDEEDGGWRIGGGVRLSALEAWAEDRIPMLARMLRFFASRQIKNQATLAGNICNASPIGDLPPVLLALDAVARIRGPEGDRDVAMDDFFLDYRKTAMRPGEVLREFFVPALPEGAHTAAFKVSKRRELDISAVCAAMVISTGDDGAVLHARLAYGGMAATPRRAERAEAAIRNRQWNGATAELGCDALAQDFVPIDDHRGSAWYRSTVAANLLRGFLIETEGDPTQGIVARPSGTVAVPTPA